MKAITVCVDYSDYLSHILPLNRHHFDEYMIVTTPDDLDTQSVAQTNNCQVFTTNSFFDNNASFNKWIALEQGLDSLGRVGWLCLLDADIILPRTVLPSLWKNVAKENTYNYLSQLPLEDKLDVEVGNLYSPQRRMADGFILEQHWKDFPIHPHTTGYCQIFHADDPHLPNPPWHQINWHHAGGADTYFAKLWPSRNCIQLPFEVLHVGQAGVNWCGRVSPYLTGKQNPQARARMRQLRRFITTRKATHNHAHEKLPIPLKTHK